MSGVSKLWKTVGVLAVILVAVGVWAWTTMSGGAPMSVSAPVEGECEPIEVYDRTLTYIGPDQQVVWEFEHSGADSRMVRTRTSLDGSTTLGLYELIIKDGVGYGRHSGDEDPPAYGPWRISGTGLIGYPDRVPCRGADLDRGSAADGFRTEYALPAEQGGGTETLQIWTDSQGRPDHGIRTTRRDGETFVVNIDYIYGQTNRISAPIATPTPTATVTPRPTRTPTPVP